MAAPAVRAAARPSDPVRDLSQTATPEATGFDPVRLQKLDAYMVGAVAEGRVPGMTMLLARHGKVVSFKSYGKVSLETGAPMGRDSIFRLYSMTKPITGVAMMILYEEGKWRLDDPVTRYIPEFKGLRVIKGVDSAGKPIVEPAARPPTMREIMSHSAGFGYDLDEKNPIDKLYRDTGVFKSVSMQQMIDRTAAIPLKFQPGTGWAYSSSVDVQGAIVERLTGMSLGDFMQKRIFGPLKMGDTGFWVRPDGARRLAEIYVDDPSTGKLKIYDKGVVSQPDPLKPPYWDAGGHGLYGTTSDYARFCQMILNGGKLDGVRIVSPASIALMGANVLPHDALNALAATGRGLEGSVGFGLDFLVDVDPPKTGSMEGKNTISWIGAAGTWFWIDPTNDVLFVGMVQRLKGTGGDDLGAQARTFVYQALLHPER
jgi:CubicO group peptidase (beta-lactamase class C family)